jgi:CRISPR-associated protein (TIGR02710 family)
LLPRLGRVLVDDSQTHGANLAADARARWDAGDGLGIRVVHQRAPLRFMDGEWVLDTSRQREIVPMDNPFESTGLLGEGQAIELFNRRAYGPAALVFEDVKTKVTGVERSHYYSGFLLLAESFAAWDVADYGTALEKLSSARRELSVDFTETAVVERAGVLAEHIRANLSFLGRVQGKLSVENVVDMVENTRRRITDQGRYDDGVARLYRAVEMWHQWRLMRHYSVSTKQVDWDRVDDDSREQFLKATNLTQFPETLDLVRTRALNQILSDQHKDHNVLRDLLRQRNSSILAHGLEPTGKGSAERFVDYVDAKVDEPEIQLVAEHVRLREL